MGKEAITASTQEIGQYIQGCRNGQMEQNGYNLWVHSHNIQSNGGSLETVGITNDQVREYLVVELKSWIDGIQQGTSEIGHSIFSLDLIEGYFLPGDPDEPPIEEGIFEQLDITLEDFKNLRHQVEVRAAREELEKCRTEGVTSSFFGLQDRLLKGETTLEEIESTQVEIDEYTDLYLGQFPNQS